MPGQIRVIGQTNTLKRISNTVALSPWRPICIRLSNTRNKYFRGREGHVNVGVKADAMISDPSAAETDTYLKTRISYNTRAYLIRKKNNGSF